jgi:hypothetical protein
MESWVVRDIWQTTNIKRGGNFGLATVPIQLTAAGVKRSIDDALWKKGLRITPAKQHEFKVCHGLRKYFKTYAQRTMKEAEAEQLLGHSGGWSNVAYNRPPPEWLVEAYLKAVPDLTIYKKKENEALEQTQTLMTQMESKDQELKELKEQMADVIEQQQGFDLKFQRILEIVDQVGAITHGNGITEYIGEEIVKMMPRPPTEGQRLQKVREFQEERRRAADAPYRYDAPSTDDLWY